MPGNQRYREAIFRSAETILGFAGRVEYTPEIEEAMAIVKERMAEIRSPRATHADIQEAVTAIVRLSSLLRRATRPQP